jgi:peptidyl-prolyl cis-trans isomerase A (cyclophilin A)
MRSTKTVFLALAVLVVMACGRNAQPHFHPRAAAQPPPSSSSAIARPAPPPSTPVPPTPPSGPVVPAPSASADPRLMSPATLTARAPATYTVELDTTAGSIRLDVTRAWSPNGADRFFNLVTNGFFTDVAFFRVIDGFMAQCGIHGNPTVAAAWAHANIPDDPTEGAQHNMRGFASFATAGPGTRTTQFFINLVDNTRLDSMGFTPFARVREADMPHAAALSHVYGEGAPAGHGPTQGRIQTEGNAYLRASFPDLSYIRSARVL